MLLYLWFALHAFLFEVFASVLFPLLVFCAMRVLCVVIDMAWLVFMFVVVLPCDVIAFVFVIVLVVVRG